MWRLAVPSSAMLGGVAVWVLAALLPCIAVSLVADQYELPFPLAYYTLIWSENPFGLVFGLLVVLPCGLSVSTMVCHRFLAYDQRRAEGRPL